MKALKCDRCGIKVNGNKFVKNASFNGIERVDTIVDTSIELSAARKIKEKRSPQRPFFFSKAIIFI